MISRHRLDACAPCGGACGRGMRRGRRAGAGANRRRRPGEWRRGRACRRTGDVLRAPIVIAADGASSRVARALGLARMPRGRGAGRSARTSKTWRRTRGRGPLRRDALARRTLHRHRAAAGRCHQRVRRDCGSRGAARSRAAARRHAAHRPQLAERFAGRASITRPVCLGPLAVDARAAGRPDCCSPATRPASSIR